MGRGTKLFKYNTKGAMNTISESFIAIGYESRSSLAAMKRQGTPKPLSSPRRATSTSNSAALFKEYSSELR